MAERNAPRSTGPAGYAARRAVLLCDCGHETQVVNTRGTENGDVIRRQRACKQGCAVFTTYESRVNPKREARTLERFERAVDAVTRVFAEFKKS